MVLIAIATPHLFLASFAKLIHILVLLDAVAGSPEFFNITEANGRADSITGRAGILGPVIEDLDLVFANQIQQRFSVFTCNCDAIAWHGSILG